MKLELHILRKLNEAHPRLIKRSVLFAEVGFEVDDLTESAFARSLALLDEKGQVWIDAGEDVTRIKITPEGMARVAEAR